MFAAASAVLADPPAAKAVGEKCGLALPSLLAVLVGMMALFSMIPEGAVLDWSALYLTEARAGRERALADQQKAQAARVPGTSPTLSLEKYAATYADSMYGQIKVTKENDGLTMSFGPEFTGDLKHWHFDTFRVSLDTPTPSPVAVVFRLGADAEVDDVQIDLAGPITFARRPDPSGPTP